MVKKVYILFLLLLFITAGCGKNPVKQDSNKSYKLSGIVAGKNGAGIGGIAVQITGTSFSAVDTTDSGGVFGFAEIKPGNYTVKAEKDSVFFKPANICITVKDSDIGTFNFTVAENYIHGRVIDIMTDKGVPDFMVQIIHSSTFPDTLGDFIDSTKTDSNGEFSFYNLEKRKYTIDLILKDKLNPSPYLLHDIESKAFANQEIIIPTFYISSEKLRFTAAKFSENSQILYLEWTPSKSELVSNYKVYFSSSPSGTKLTQYFRDNSYLINNATIKITPQLMATIFGVDVISAPVYFTVSAIYKTPNSTACWGIFSENISIRLSW
jgi:hypothetical protein